MIPAIYLHQNGESIAKEVYIPVWLIYEIVETNIIIYIPQNLWDQKYFSR